MSFLITSIGFVIPDGPQGRSRARSLARIRLNGCARIYGFRLSRGALGLDHSRVFCL
jgi:hypothetical protein